MCLLSRRSSSWVSIPLGLGELELVRTSALRMPSISTPRLVRLIHLGSSNIALLVSLRYPLSLKGHADASGLWMFALWIADVDLCPPSSCSHLPLCLLCSMSTKVLLETSDKETFSVDKEVTERSVMLKNMLEGQSILLLQESQPP